MRASCRVHRRGPDGRAVRRAGRLAADRRVRGGRPTAGWWRSGWCPRASTCRGWRSASTPPRPPPRCSSPRPSAASCEPGGAARPRRSSCRRCRCCWSTPPSWRPSATTSSAGGRRRTGSVRPRTRWWPQAEPRPPSRASTTSWRSRRSEAEATFDRVLFDGGEFGTHAAAGSDEEEDYLGLPGLLEPDQVATLLRARQAEQVAARSRRGGPGAGRADRVRDPARAAQGAQRAGRRLAPPHRPAARDVHTELGRARAGRSRPRPRRDAAAPGDHDPGLGGRSGLMHR